MNNYKVSVCIPLYNVENYVIECIDSVLEQTYRNIEIILVDDSSKDCTFELITSKYSSDDRVLILQNEHNMGVAYTRNRALSASSGDYIALMDADDICHPDRIRLQLDKLLAENANFCASDAELIDEKNSRVIGYWQSPENIEELRLLLCVKIPFPQPSVMLKREIFEKFKYNERELSEDYRLWTEISGEIKYVCIKSPLVKVRINPTSVSKVNLHPLLKSAHFIRVSWISKEFIDLTQEQISSLHNAFSQGSERNYKSLKVTIYVLLRISKLSEIDRVNMEFLDQIFWMSVRHSHISFKVPALYIQSNFLFGNPDSILKFLKRTFIITFLSIFKLEYGSSCFNKLKAIIWR
ncbi:glycosyltransferase family 2 protein [Vibrio mimicus]|uniref:Glycosyltransferase 2-like domain-containing protein n=1 Tax=Vibrio mimicus VM603 TaxID=671074 RepID=D2YGE2_VIBMI|nr:glycosyltransferase family 2 protein [Vibrio mimicus]EEW06179.1 conserved hypothetical protein [Vibrio mimicus VM603]